MRARTGTCREQRLEVVPAGERTWGISAASLTGEDENQSMAETVGSKKRI